MTERELVWVPKDLLREVQVFIDVGYTEEQIKKLRQRFRDDIETYDELMDSDLVEFRAHAVKVRNSYSKVVDEEIDATYQLWESLAEKRTEAQKKLEETREITRSIKSDVDELKSEIKNLSLYDLEKLLSVIEQVKYMNESDKQLLIDVFNVRRKTQ